MTERGDYYACPCGHHDYAVMRRVDQGCVPDDHRYVDMPTCAKCGNEFFDDEPACGYPCDCHRGPVDDADGNLCAQCGEITEIVFGPRGGSSEANARLIAASPTMLDALRAAESTLAALYPSVEGLPDHPTLVVVRAAVAKAGAA